MSEREHIFSVREEDGTVVEKKAVDKKPQATGLEAVLLASAPGALRRLGKAVRLGVLTGLLANTAAAQLCTAWSEAVTLGRLDASLLPEASGVAASSRFPGRLYHVNDSGDGPFFYLTDMAGAATERVRILAFDAQGTDVEDLSLGPCGSDGDDHGQGNGQGNDQGNDQNNVQGSCLFIADIGDNLITRETLQVLVVQEAVAYHGSAPLQGRVTLAYPDGPHDAEGFAVHPSGDFYLLTKARVSELRAAPARLYTLSRADWQEARGAGTLRFVAAIDLRTLSGLPIDLLSHIATALDISADGERLLVLSYGNAYEILLASVLAGGALEPGRDYSRILLRRLPQQESIAYLPDGRSFVYSSEARGSAAELVRLNCLD
jgi:hypothetical protein